MAQSGRKCAAPRTPKGAAPGLCECDFDDDELLSMGQSECEVRSGDCPDSLFLQKDAHHKNLALWDRLCVLGLRARSPESHDAFKQERGEK